MQVFPYLGTIPVHKEDLQTLSLKNRRGLFEKHIFYSFMVIPAENDPTMINEIKEEAFIKTLTTFEHTILTGSLSDWKRTFELYLLDNPPYATEKKHLSCKIIFLLENTFRLFSFFKEYKKIKLPDTSFYLERI